jgi:hypothetical protein
MNHFHIATEKCSPRTPPKRIAQEVGTPAYLQLGDAQAPLQDSIRPCQSASYRLFFSEG